MGNIITLLIIIVILGLATSYIIVQKKRGVKCIGCVHGKPVKDPNGEEQHGCSGCHSCNQK